MRLFSGRNGSSTFLLTERIIQKNIYRIALEILPKECFRLYEKYLKLIDDGINADEAILKIAKEERINPKSLRRTIKHIQELIRLAK